MLGDSADRCCWPCSCLIEQNGSDTRGQMLSVTSGPQGPFVLPADIKSIQFFTGFSALCFSCYFQFFKVELNLQGKIQEL
jgi:hypothetical protein